MANGNNIKEEYKILPHYHGDIVRILFIVSGVIMLISLPFFQDRIPFPISTSILFILLLDFIAGYTNPKQKWIVFFDTVIAAGGFVFFEYYAVTNYSLTDLFFWINQILALLFFITLYNSTKTLRGSLLKK